MKNFPPLYLLLFFLTSCYEKNSNSEHMKSNDDDNMNKGTLLTRNFYDAVPYENSADSAVIIEVEVNHKERRFLLDTGAPLSISESLQEECNFPLLRESTLQDSNGDTSSIKIIAVTNLSIGNVQFQNIPAMVFDMKKFPFECEKLDGIIGSNLLRLLIVQFNKPKGEVIFTDHSDSLKLNSGDISDLFLDSTQSDPRIVVHPGENAADTCTFDTGDKSFYIVAAKRIDSSANNKTGNMSIIARGAGLGTMGLVGKTQFNSKSYLMHFDSFFVGKHLFGNVVAAPTNAERSRIGRGLFKYGIVTLDYPKHLFCFTPYRELECDSLKSFGINYISNNGKLLIATVWGNTEAYRAGLKPGFEIIQFGNFKPSSKNECEWSPEFRHETTRKELHIVYLNEKGMQKEITLPKTMF